MIEEGNVNNLYQVDFKDKHFIIAFKDFLCVSKEYFGKHFEKVKFIVEKQGGKLTYVGKG